MDEGRDVDRDYASPEERAYAQWLDHGMRIGFVMLVATFTAYAGGFVPPHVPVEDLPRLWTLPVNDYLREADVGTGWAWLRLLGTGDYLNFGGIAFLSAVTIACYARIVPVFAASRDRVYLAIALVEIVVLGLAASGLLVIGH